MSSGLLYMSVFFYWPCKCKNAAAIANSFSSEIYFIVFVSLLPIISYRAFIQKMKVEGYGKGGERREKTFLGKKRANNSLNCMDFIIYAPYLGILT